MFLSLLLNFYFTLFHLLLYWLFWYWNLHVEDKVNKVVVVHIYHGYTHLITSSALKKKRHKIHLSGLFGDFLFYVILTISYLRALTIETSLFPNDSIRPWSMKHIEILSGILTVYFNFKYFSIHTHELLGPNPCGGNNLIGCENPL